MPCDFISSTMLVLSWSLPANATSRQITPLGFRAMMPRNDAAQSFLGDFALQTNRQRAVRYIVKRPLADFAVLNFDRERQIAFQYQFVKQRFIRAAFLHVVRHEFQLLGETGGVFGC